MLKQILIVAGAIILLMVGALLGLLYQMQNTVPQPQQQVEQPDPLLGILSSNTVSSIVAQGKISQIQGDAITITSDKSLTARVTSNTSINLIKDDSKGEKQQVALKDLKIGDSVTLNLKLLPNKQFEAFFIFIQPK